ncbi:MAG TPA: glutamate acetyltransferase [Cyanobacteria bacterium UBA11049]|nr:glutamate acetyltransferase [Cyanobacteria bacterium UBA11049]
MTRHLWAALELYIFDRSVLARLKSPPLKRIQQQQRVLYVSAIALQLSSVLKLPAMDIARALAELVCHQTDGQDFTVQVVPPGWIYLELTEFYLAAWLQHLIQAPPELELRELGKSNPKSKIELSLFAVQYAHARCCSLLQLAHREELISLKPTSAHNSALWLAVAPLPIPWLNREQKLCLCHSGEWSLIYQFCAILDELYCPYPSRQPPNWHKAALSLSQAFQIFYSYCRIWGEVKSQNLPLAQARLGLVLITQSLLRLLLQSKLGIVAPSEV